MKFSSFKDGVGPRDPRRLLATDTEPHIEKKPATIAWGREDQRNESIAEKYNLIGIPSALYTTIKLIHVKRGKHRIGLEYTSNLIELETCVVHCYSKRRTKLTIKCMD